MAETTFQKKEYVESDAVRQAKQSLEAQAASKPGAYASKYQSGIDDTINKIMNREKFSYDLNGDALYQQYKDQYSQQGKMAMMDTMGQAAAMTGGYGSSYGQSVGQQAYQGYLQQLNDVVPELYQMAYQRYQDKGNDLLQQYSLLAGEEADVYARQMQAEQDAVADHQYNTGFGYQAYRDQVSDKQWQQSFDYQKDKDQAAAKQAADKAAAEAAEESILDKPVYSHIDDETGLYHYYLDGKEVKYEQGINPITGTVNPDVEKGVFYKNGNNIRGVKLEKTGITDYINGHEQNVWRKSDDGSWWMWDDTKNAYVPHKQTDNFNDDHYKEANTKAIDKFKQSIMPKVAFGPTASNASYKNYIQQQIEKADSYLTQDEVYTLMRFYGFIE